MRAEEILKCMLKNEEYIRYCKSKIDTTVVENDARYFMYDPQSEQQVMLFEGFKIKKNAWYRYQIKMVTKLNNEYKKQLNKG